MFKYAVTVDCLCNYVVHENLINDIENNVNKQILFSWVPYIVLYFIKVITLLWRCADVAGLVFANIGKTRNA